MTQKEMESNRVKTDGRATRVKQASQLIKQCKTGYGFLPTYRTPNNQQHQQKQFFTSSYNHETHVKIKDTDLRQKLKSGKTHRRNLTAGITIKTIKPAYKEVRENKRPLDIQI